MHVAQEQQQDLAQAFASFNRMSTELEGAYRKLEQEVVGLRAELAQARLMREWVERQKRLSVIGEMAAALAHQIRTPLSAALLYASQIATPGLSEADRSRFADRTRSCLHDLERLVNDMLAFARGGGGVVENFSLSALLEHVAHCLEPKLTDGAQLTIRTLAPELKLRGNSEALSGALLNLASNAFENGDSEVKVVIEVRSPQPDWAEIRVTDNGPGVPEELRARIFEPFFTTRKRGTGLGLAVVKSVVVAHGGEVTLEDGPAGGASFVLRLPLVQSAAVTALSPIKIAQVS
jgi:two-component system sensor histidine kinase FlrB